MPSYNFPTDITPGDSGQTDWANEVGEALNELGPVVGNLPVFLGGTTPTPDKYLWLKVPSSGLVELWIEDGA
jgi:hypothetical protein